MKQFWSLRAGVLAMAMGLAAPALALTAEEARAVVDIVEVMAAETGEGMVADAGDLYFDYDSLGANRIPAAGFSRESWAVAYDAVASGYMATLSQEDFDAVFAAPMAQLEASALPEDQKTMLRDHIAGLVAEAQATRQQGMVHADVVRPLEDRLYALFFGDFEE
ncbi:hypothetical protein [Devosia sp.]|uniref:hypothetical protein n=1 Tax=Devosia sp. TaxID=1871048 RepID=UPI001AC862BD|nr:hypothetical protein [Devosia sp.]MBN9335230.1 hypothetical protein [Devosia sp.]